MFNDLPIKVLPEHKHMGIILSLNLSWNKQIKHICARASSKLGVKVGLQILNVTSGDSISSNE